MKIIIGLGNPGSEYTGTKHNIGFAVVNAFAKEAKAKIEKEKYGSLIGKARVGEESIMLVLPQTFMNLSGKAVEELVREECNDDISNIIVVCDDINLELGKIRIRKKGSAGGQKGLDSIIRFLNRDDFARLRVGIATEAHKGDITDYVLSPFKRKYARNAAHAVNLAKEALFGWVEEGVDAAMTKFNKRKVGTS